MLYSTNTNLGLKKQPQCDKAHMHFILSKTHLEGAVWFCEDPDLKGKTSKL